MRAWLAPEEVKIEDRFRQSIDRLIRVHDKLLLILSEDSVSSDWIEQEVEAVLAREREQNEVLLFPVRLDNKVMEIKTGWPAQIRNTHRITDFSQWQDQDAFQQAFQNLLRDLTSSHGVLPQAEALPLNQS